VVKVLWGGYVSGICGRGLITLKLKGIERCSLLKRFERLTYLVYCPLLWLGVLRIEV